MVPLDVFDMFLQVLQPVRLAAKSPSDVSVINGMSLFMELDGLFLAIVSIRPVLAKEMFVEQNRLDRLRPGIDAQGLARQPGDKFQDARVVNRVRDIFAPSEWPVTRHQNSRVPQWIKF